MKLAMFFLAVSLFFVFGAGVIHLTGGPIWMVIACISASVTMAIIGGMGVYFEREAARETALND